MNIKNIAAGIGIAVVCFVGGFLAQNYINNTDDKTISIDIVGKTKYDLGDIAEFSTLINNEPKNLKKTTAWKVLKDGQSISFKTLPDEHIIFPVGVKPTKITVLTHLVYIDPKTKNLTNSDFFVQDVTVGTPGPDPGPGPGPDPSPDKPVDGKYKIAVLVYTKAKDLVHSSNLANSAKALSKSYLATAQDITDNKYTTLKDVYDGLKTSNGKAVTDTGDSISNWKAWNDEIRHYIATLNNTKQVQTLADHADLFREIANGLSFVK